MPCQSQSSLYASEKRWSLAVADCWRRNCFLCCLWYLYFITISNILECQLPVIKLLFCFSYPLILKYRSWIDLWLRNTAGSSDSCVEWMRMHAIFWFMLLLFVFFFVFKNYISSISSNMYGSSFFFGKFWADPPLFASGGFRFCDLMFPSSCAFPNSDQQSARFPAQTLTILVEMVQYGLFLCCYEVLLTSSSQTRLWLPMDDSNKRQSVGATGGCSQHCPSHPAPACQESFQESKVAWSSIKCGG